jgi:uncharacterized ion transporter superfamily protein YfcC
MITPRQWLLIFALDIVVLVVAWGLFRAGWWLAGGL